MPLSSAAPPSARHNGQDKSEHTARTRAAEGQKMTLSAPAERAVTFYSKGQPAFLLEGVVHTPDSAGPAPTLILCHPQPASSDMNDSLLTTLAKDLADAGFTALRFN